MPAQNLEKQSEHVLKVLKMVPSIPSNNSHEQLMPPCGDEAVEPDAGGTPGLRDVKRREWMAILILFFVNLINYMDRFTLAGILQDVQKHFKIGDDEGGLLQTSFVLSYMVFAPLFGYLGDRYSRKWIMTGGVFLWSLTTLMGSFMDNFGLFIFFRALVGIGEASYSTIAPTIISDLFVHNVRSQMLAVFYFAIPVGSGLGYIVGSETAKAAGAWQWALRVTPILGVVAVLLLMFVLEDPERGQSEGSGHLQAGALKEDIKELVKNRSFMFSTVGSTCVAFVAGALAWWGPKLMQLGLALQQDSDDNLDDLSMKFGVVTILAGVSGLTLGCYLSQTLGVRWAKADPLICAGGLLTSCPLILGAMFTSNTTHTVLCYVLLFLGQVALNLNWAIVADILLYVVLPTRRSTAEGMQLLISHALGDAGSPYIIGIVSEALKVSLASTSTAVTDGLSSNGTLLMATEVAALTSSEDRLVKFHALQYALLITCFVEVLGGLFFLINAFYIVDDKSKVEEAIKATSTEPSHIIASETEHSALMS